MTTNGTLTTLLSFGGTNGLSPQAGLAAGGRWQFLWHHILRRSGLQWRVLQRRWDYLPPRSGPRSDAAGDYRATRQPDRARQRHGDLQRQCRRRRPVELFLAAQRRPIAGATQSSYTTNNVQLADSGGQFSCVISNAYGSVTSSNAALTVFNASGPLFSFNGPDGGYSSAALVQGADGNFYGTTQYGGTNGEGTVFRMTTNGTLTILASFNYSGMALILMPGWCRAPMAISTAPQRGRNGRLWHGVQNDDQWHTDHFGFLQLFAMALILTPGWCRALTAISMAPHLDGGAYYDGTVFRMTTNGTLTTLASFNYYEWRIILMPGWCRAPMAISMAPQPTAERTAMARCSE